MESTILIKKKDGSTVRMTMSQFNAYQKAQNEGGAKVPEDKKNKERNHDKSQAHKPHFQTTHHAKKNEAPKPPKAWNSADHQSLLEDDVVTTLPAVSVSHEVATTSPVVNIFVDEAKANIISSGYSSSAMDLVKTIGWQGSQDDLRRLSSLIESRVKDVRSDDQFLAYAMTPPDRGGAGLPMDKAQELLANIKKTMSSEPYAKKALSQSKLNSEIRIENKKIESANIPLYRESTKVDIQNSVRPLIQDIVSPPIVKKSLGPAEEFATFGLAEFHRLSPTISAATLKIKEKFDVWRDESYVFFLDVKDGWYRSPIYRMYMDILLASLQNRKKVSDVIAQNDKAKNDSLTMDIFLAVLDINKYLSDR